MPSEGRTATTLPIVVSVVGRWARLDNGDFVTPVPAFKDTGYDDRLFDDLIAAFQADPAGEINRRGVVDRVPAHKPRGE